MAPQKHKRRTTSDEATRGSSEAGRRPLSSGAAPEGSGASIEKATEGVEAARLVQAIIRIEDDDVAAGATTVARQENEEADGKEVAGLRDRLNAIWQAEGTKAAQAEVARLYQAAGLDMMSNPVALKPLYSALRRAIAHKAKDPQLMAVASARHADPNRDTETARLAREHISAKRLLSTCCMVS